MGEHLVSRLQMAKRMVAHGARLWSSDCHARLHARHHRSSLRYMRAIGPRSRMAYVHARLPHLAGRPMLGHTWVGAGRKVTSYHHGCRPRCKPWPKRAEEIVAPVRLTERVKSSSKGRAEALRGVEPIMRCTKRYMLLRIACPRGCNTLKGMGLGGCMKRGAAVIVGEGQEEREEEGDRRFERQWMGDTKARDDCGVGRGP